MRAVLRRRNLLLLRSPTRRPELTIAEQCEFHLFLSHVWSSGQDQVRWLLMPPGCLCVPLCASGCLWIPLDA